MKKIITLAAAIGLFSMTSMAQGISYGPMVGLNMSNITGDGVSGSMKMGLHIGGVAQIGISEQFSIMPGLLFSSKGAKFNEGVEVTRSLNYLEIPVNVVYSVRNTDLWVMAGPYFGYALSGKDKADAGSADIKFGDGGYKRTDFGLNIGVGYNLPKNLFVKVQYGLGLAAINSKPPAPAPSVSHKNTCIGISVGMLFGK